jgi:hypothetical protein
MKTFLLLVFLLISARAASPDIVVGFIIESEPINAYDKLLKAIVQVESSGDTLAYNKIEGAVGAFQIRYIRLLDYNRRTGKNIKHSECYSYQVSEEIFLYYAKKQDYHNYELIARNWNGSGKTTLDYWKKVKVLL